MTPRKKLLLTFAVVVLIAIAIGALYVRSRVLVSMGDSGGALRPLQAAYDQMLELEGEGKYQRRWEG